MLPTCDISVLDRYWQPRRTSEAAIALVERRLILNVLLIRVVSRWRTLAYCSLARPQPCSVVVCEAGACCRSDALLRRTGHTSASRTV